MMKIKKYNSQYDKMINEPIPSLLVQLSIPTIISMLVTNIYNMADTAFVGQLGTSASGAVGIVFGFMAIIQAFGFMFGQGSGSILARKLGRKDIEGASVTASTAFFCSLFFGLLISIFSYLFLDQLINVLGSTPTIAPYAKIYISYIIISAPIQTASFVLNNQLRYEGKATLGMIGMLTGSILNIGLDPLFMFVFKMGIAGAGLATCLTQYISFFILLSMFLLGKTQSKLSINKVSFKNHNFWDITSTGFPSLLRQGLNSLTTILLNLEAAVYGDAAVAAFSIVSRIIFFVFSTALGIGQGFQPISSFSYGARKYGRLRRAFKDTAILAETLMVILSLIVFINADSMIKIFRDDPEVIVIGTRALKLQLIAQLLLPATMCVEMLFQSTGQKLGAVFMSGCRSGFIFIPTLLILSKLRGLAGIQEAQAVAFGLSIFPALALGINYFNKLPKEDMPSE